jgi:DNA repair protein RadC
MAGRAWQSKAIVSVSDDSLSETESLSGISVAEAVTSALVIVSTTGDAVDLLRPFFASRPEERVAVVHLGKESRFLALTIDDSPSHEHAELPVAAIVGMALKIGATGIVVAHNHPSGDPRPSAADEAATKALAAAAAGVDIRLQDHIIFGAGECSSFRSLGLL